jgi:hypothetical protein
LVVNPGRRWFRVTVAVRGRPLTTLEDWFELENEARRALEEWAYGESEYLEVFGLMFDMDAKEVRVDLGYGSKYYEISEAVASGVEQRCAEDGLSPEECEELYEKAYRDMLEEINSECVINISRTVGYPEKGVVAEIYPIECDGDYCFCGAGITLRVSLGDVRTIEEGVRRVVDAVKYAFGRIYSEIIAPH